MIRVGVVTNKIKHLKMLLMGLALYWCYFALAAYGNIAAGWSSYVGGDYNNDSVLAVAGDSSGSLFFGGFLGDGWMRLGEGEDYWMDAEFAHGFVAHVSAQGSVAWVADFGAYDNFYDEVRAIARQGTALVAAGMTRNSPTDEGQEAFVASLDPEDGSVRWITRIGSSSEVVTNGFNAVAIDATGNIYAAGYTSLSNQVCNVPGYSVGSVTYGTQLKGGVDALVVKLSPAGDILWRHYLGGVNTDQALAIAISTDGTLFVGGETYSAGWASLPSGVPQPAAASGFLVKLKEDGTHHWSTFLGGSNVDALTALAVENETGSLYAGGRTSSADFRASDPRLNTHAGSTDGFLMRITDTNTAFRTDWCCFVGGASKDEITALALKENLIVAGGSTHTGGWLPQAANSHQGGEDGFVIAFGTNGVPNTSLYMGGNRGDRVHALCTTDTGLTAAGATFSPSWVAGGFWDDWSKHELFGGGEFGFIATLLLGAPPVEEPSGALTITLAPAEAINVGAAWSFDSGTTWLASGTTTNLAPGSYTIAFHDATGYVTPSNLTGVVVTDGTSTARHAVYAAVPLPLYAVRRIDGSAITITVTPPDGEIFVWSVEETLPMGLTPSNLNGPGASWDAGSRTITWVLLGATGAKLSYDLAGEPGIYQLVGRATFGGPYEAVVGADSVVIDGNGEPDPSEPELLPPNILSLHLVAGEMFLTFASLPTFSYVVQTNSAPSRQGWADCTLVEGTGETTCVALPVTTENALFYRVRTIEP